MSVTRAPRSRAASRDRDAHLAGRAVADEADRVDRLRRAARGDHDVPAGQVGLADGADDAAAARRDRRPGSAGPPTAATTASTIAGSSASRPTPAWPEASGPTSGSTMR